MLILRSPSPGVTLRRWSRGALLSFVLAGTQLGCGREFFREWANQDVSEAVFEKSRDPRWRLDTFSIEPPALSRFADPYDPDYPPAPPDDVAAEALSPVPQWPDNRLIVPAEGTGYIDVLERWKQEGLPPRRKRVKRDNDAKKDAKDKKQDAGESSNPAGGESTPPKPSGTSSPFSPGPDAKAPAATPPPGASPGPAGGSASRNTRGNPGTAKRSATPILLTDARPTKPKSPIPPPRSFSSLDRQAQKASAIRKDGAVVRTSRQDPATTGNGGQRTAPDVPRDVTVPLDTNPNERDMAAPNLPRPDQLKPAGPGGTFDPAQAAELAGILVPSVPTLNEAAAAGLPSTSRPYKVSMQQAFALALINSRYYQTNLENVYTSALAVTLQRFAFAPQFYAGLTPRTSPTAGFPSTALSGGFPGANPLNQFLYNTRKSPGGQVSALQIGDIAGYGKLLNSGGQLLMGFANQVVFNFVGNNPKQPTVQSSLPLSFVQPFLRGGGRAVTLEPLTLAERALLYQVRAFAKFRQEFIVTVLTGGTVQNFGSTFNLAGFSTAGNIDPVIGFIPVLVDVISIDINRRNLAAFEQIVNLYKQLIEGEASGLTQLQVDQAESQRVSALSTLIQTINQYRSDLDQFKVQLGLPPDLPMIPDLGLITPFQDVFQTIDDWQRNPRRNLDDLPGIVGEIPQLQDVVLDGRSVLGIYKGSNNYNEEDALEDILQSGVRIAMEWRLDLMNARAQLYDAWRQLRVTANALRGVLNVAITNQVFTPPTTTNPFGFFDQAKQFSLVLNAELPLIRLAERNSFRTSIINYERQRRQLMNTEDNVKFQLRQDIRNMQVQFINYEIAKQNLILNIRLKDQAFEQIIAPPQGAAGSQGLAQSANAATQTSNLLGFQSRLIQSELALVNGWQAFQNARLTLYRDIGTLPYDEWEAFSELFPSEYRGPVFGGPTADARPAAAPASNPPQGVAR